MYIEHTLLQKKLPLHSPNSLHLPTILHVMGIIWFQLVTALQSVNKMQYQPALQTLYLKFYVTSNSVQRLEITVLNNFIMRLKYFIIIIHFSTSRSYTYRLGGIAILGHLTIRGWGTEKLTFLFYNTPSAIAYYGIFQMIT